MTRKRPTEYTVAPNITRRDGSEGTTFRARARIGANRKISESFDTLTEAKAWLEDVRAGYYDEPDGQSSPPRKTDEWIYTDWFEHWMKVQDHLSNSTAKTYRSLARTHLIPAFGQCELADIRSSDVMSFQTRLRTAKKSQATIDKCRQILGSSLSLAALDGHITVNPTHGLPRRRRAHSDPGKKVALRYLDVAQLDELETCMDPWWRLAVRVQVETGLRIGELAALRVCHVDLTTGTVLVERSMRKDGELGPTKTEAGMRTVRTLMDNTLARIVTQIAERGQEPDDFLFTGPRGGRLDQDTYRRRKFNPAMRAAGLGHILTESRSSTHVLRHTLATNLIAFTPIGTMGAAAVLGHADGRVTEQIYTHLQNVPPPDCRDALRKLYRGSDDEGATGVLAQA